MSGGLSLCHLLYVVRVIIVSDYICTRMNLYTVTVCADGVIMYMCLCLLFVAFCLLYYWLGIFHL